MDDREVSLPLKSSDRMKQKNNPETSGCPPKSDFLGFHIEILNTHSCDVITLHYVRREMQQDDRLVTETDGCITSQFERDLQLYSVHFIMLD